MLMVDFYRMDGLSSVDLLGSDGLVERGTSARL